MKKRNMTRKAGRPPNGKKAKTGAERVKEARERRRTRYPQKTHTKVELYINKEDLEEMRTFSMKNGVELDQAIVAMWRIFKTRRVGIDAWRKVKESLEKPG